GSEAVGLRDQPVGQLPAVTAAFDAQAFTINPRVAAQRGLDAVQNILRLAAVLIAEDRVGELLPVAGRAAIIDHQHSPSMRGVNLSLRNEARSLLSVRPAVYHRDHRVF